MTQDGRQVETLHRALLSAFPTQRALEQMVRFGMDLNLAEVASGNLSDQVFDILRYAEARGLVPQLVESALAANPTNPDLRAVEPWLRAQQASGVTTDGYRRARRTLLDDASTEATERLRAIGLETLAPVLLEEQPHQVARPWDDEAGAPLRRRTVILATDILQVFDTAAISGRLLILGAPGSGKTTLLLQLMQHLIARVDPDHVSPIPVLISLASWKNDNSIGDWVVDQLKLKYGVRVDLGARWRDERRLTLLLDGLDEVAADHQHACVKAINEFEQAYTPPYLVVCSRLAEYENLTIKLHLRGAVCLRPFDAEQIRAYLDRRGSPERWTTISSDQGLLEMAGSPLLLSLMSVLPSAPDVQRAALTPADRRRRLFDSYVSSRVSASTNRGEYSGERTRQSLTRLARMLQKQGQSEFLVERMQPAWLESAPQRASYRAGVLIVTGTAVLLVMQTASAIFDLVPPGNTLLAVRSQLHQLYAANLDRPMQFSIAAILGAVVASRRTIVPVETLTWSWSHAWRNMRQWAQTAAWKGLDYGTALGVAIMVFVNYAAFEVAPATSRWRIAGELSGAIGGVIGGVFLALSKPSHWRIATLPLAMTRRRIVEALIGGLLYAVVTAMTLIWLGGLLAGISVFVMLGLNAAMTDRYRGLCLKTMMCGAIIGPMVGAFSGFVLSPAVPLFPWFSTWVGGGVAVGLITGLVVSLGQQARKLLQPTGPRAPRGWTWPSTVAIGFAIGISLGAAALVAVRAGGDELVRGVATSVWFVHVSFVTTAGLAPMFAFSGSIAGAGTASILAGLAGAVSGATGAAVERRLVPNQGIRQSGVNVAIFAALGTVVIGIPYGLFNFTLSVAATGVLPSPADWLHLAVAPGVMFGVLAGLVPGAACIQHFVLRLVLWASGVLPLRLVGFLDAATRRRLLQRVGGRYRFIHILLRDHLAQFSHAVQ